MVNTLFFMGSLQSDSLCPRACSEALRETSSVIVIQSLNEEHSPTSYHVATTQ